MILTSKSPEAPSPHQSKEEKLNASVAKIENSNSVTVSTKTYTEQLVRSNEPFKTFKDAIVFKRKFFPLYDDFSALRKTLEIGSPNERFSVIEKMIFLTGSVNVFVKQIYVEPDIEIRHRLLSALVFIGDNDAVEGLTEILSKDDVKLHNEIMTVFKDFPEQSEKLLLSLFRCAEKHSLLLAAYICKNLLSK